MTAAIDRVSSATLPLDGRVALITGGSRGIGAAVARAMAEAGAAVALAARSRDSLEQLADELNNDGHRALAIPADVSNVADAERMIAATVEGFGRLDIACNNAAGGGQRPTRFAELPVEAYDSAIAGTLRSVFVLMKVEIPAMLASGGGSIINMASTAGLEGIGGLAGYVSAKHGIVGLTRSAALDYADMGIRVNALAPGPILTDAMQNAGPQMQAHAAQAIPMRRVGLPHEVAAAVVWLASDQSSFITGATIPVDGGKLAGMAPFRGFADSRHE